MVSFYRTIKVMLSLTLPCVCYWAYRATAFLGLLFNSVLPFWTHLRMRMANLNPPNLNLLSWDEDGVPIVTHNNITSPWYLNVANWWWASLTKWFAQGRQGSLNSVAGGQILSWISLGKKKEAVTYIWWLGISTMLHKSGKFKTPDCTNSLFLSIDSGKGACLYAPFFCLVCSGKALVTSRVSPRNKWSG